MGTRFREVHGLQGERVRMQFDDGREIVATLLCATKDIDGSKHLIYDLVEPVSGAESGVTDMPGCFYASANTLVSIELADTKSGVRTVRGWEDISLRHCA